MDPQTSMELETSPFWASVLLTRSLFGSHASLGKCLTTGGMPWWEVPVAVESQRRGGVEDLVPGVVPEAPPPYVLAESSFQHLPMHLSRPCGPCEMVGI